MNCSLTWDELVVKNGPLWKALTVPPGHYRIKLGPVEVFSTVHSLKVILAIDSLARGTAYLLSSDPEQMELEDEPDYTTLISSCGAFEGFFLLTLGLPEDFGVTMKRKNGKVILCYPDDFSVLLPTYSIRKVELPVRELGLCMKTATLNALGRLDDEIPEGLRSEYSEWKRKIMEDISSI